MTDDKRQDDDEQGLFEINLLGHRRGERAGG